MFVSAYFGDIFIDGQVPWFLILYSNVIHVHSLPFSVTPQQFSFHSNKPWGSILYVSMVPLLYVRTVLSYHRYSSFFLLIRMVHINIKTSLLYLDLVVSLLINNHPVILKGVVHIVVYISLKGKPRFFVSWKAERLVYTFISFQV